MQQPTHSHRGRLVRSVLSVLLVPLVTVLAWSPVTSRAHAAGPSTITGLHVAGNTVVNGGGQPLRLLGVDRSGTEYQCIHDNGVFDGPNDAASVQAIAAWHTTAVRVPLNEDCWLGINGAPAAYSGTTYQQAIVAYVNLLNANGLVAILDLHWNAPGTSQATGQLQMPDADHAPAFWTSVATTFKGNSAVIFDLYNEPHDISWPCWRDGGNGGVCSNVGYAVAGMQSLVTAVRNTGAANVLMLGGLAYSNDLSQWLAYKPSDPLGNLAASWHAYNFNACNNTACYDSQVAPVTQQVPLVAGEIGENDCGHGFIDALMTWLDAHGGGYLGWAWDTFDCGGFPALISSYDGMPTPFGIGFRDHLAALASSGTPTATLAPATATSTLAPAPVTSTPLPATATATLKAGNTPTPTPAPPGTATTIPRPATPTATLPPAATPTPTTSTPATATPTSVPVGGGVTVTGNATSNRGPWWGEEDVTLSNSAPLTTLRITVTVQKTPGVGYAGQYTSFPGGALSMGHTDTASAIVYTYTLNPGQTVAPGSYMVGSQHNGNGASHPTSGDTYTVTFTAGGGATTTTGHF